MTNYQTSQLHEFLKSRRSVMARNITTPGPTESQIKELIEIAARVPDHGKLAPWRFIVFENKGIIFRDLTSIHSLCNEDQELNFIR